MTMQYRPVELTTDPHLTVTLSIAGTSGTGKTYSACLFAQGLTDDGPFAILDTENNRAAHYKGDFPKMQHYNFGPVLDGQMVGFPPERWIAQLDHLEKAGVKAVVIDSFSHAWEGIGGVLEMQDAEMDRLLSEAEARAQGRYAVDAAKFQLMSWVQPKQRYRRLIEKIIQSPMDVILCMRAKPVIQVWDKDARKNVNSRETKLRRKDIPWDVASDRDLIFEMTAAMVMEPKAPGQPVLLKCPDHFRGLFAGNARVSPKMGRAMRLWAESGGRDPGEKRLLDDARTEARKGKAEFTAWWKGRTKDERAVLESIMDELRQTAERADAASSDNPWEGEERGGAAEEARALAEAEEDQRRRDAELEGRPA